MAEVLSSIGECPWPCTGIRKYENPRGLRLLKKERVFLFKVDETPGLNPVYIDFKCVLRTILPIFSIS
jgi:hypothetical protein